MSFIADLVARAQDILAAPKPTERRAIKSTSFDRADYDKVMAEIPAVQREVEELAQTVDYARDFAGDLHSMFYKVDPRLHDAGQIVPEYQTNRDIIDTVMQFPEVAHLRQHSVSDTYGTAMSMMAMKDIATETAQKVAEARSEAEQAAQEAANQAANAQQQIQDLLDQLGQPVPGGIGPSADEHYGQQLQQALDQFDQAQQQQQAAQQQASAAAQQVAEQAVNAMRSAAKQADKELSEDAQLASAFGVEDGVLQRMPVAERIELAKHLRNNRLAQFAKLLGQFKTVQQAESRKRIINASSEVHGITQSDDLTRMVAGEYLNFADPSLETLMWLRMTEHQLNTYDVRGKENLGQGPIVIVVDESGSMGAADVAGGTREAWSKALALAMVDQARRRKRDAYYIGFSSPGQQHVVEFPNGDSSLERVVAMTEHFYGGGTHYERPLMMALEIIEREFDGKDKGRPDIVFITDDEYAGLTEEFLTEYRRVKDKASIKTYGIAVGCSTGYALNAVSDNVRAITQLVESDPRAVGDLFRTI